MVERNAGSVTKGKDVCLSKIVRAIVISTVIPMRAELKSGAPGTSELVR